MKGSTIAMLLGATFGSGCADPQAERARLAEQVATLSRDQCLASSLSDEGRDRLRRAALEGRITRRDVDRYLDEVGRRVEHARRSGMKEAQFCPIQLDAWRRHLGG